ncbi:MAG: hypothetical protein DHS20C10_13480 [marine bacterium B5-7]|nr:MAG: hypothetical protein DHS20C10_13480 [marine bacterium B5-7]
MLRQCRQILFNSIVGIGRLCRHLARWFFHRLQLLKRYWRQSSAQHPCIIALMQAIQQKHGRRWRTLPVLRYAVRVQCVVHCLEKSDVLYRVTQDEECFLIHLYVKSAIEQYQWVTLLRAIKYWRPWWPVNTLCLRVDLKTDFNQLKGSLFQLQEVFKRTPSLCMQCVASDDAPLKHYLPLQTNWTLHTSHQTASTMQQLLYARLQHAHHWQSYADFSDYYVFPRVWAAWSGHAWQWLNANYQGKGVLQFVGEQHDFSLPICQRQRWQHLKQPSLIWRRRYLMIFGALAALMVSLQVYAYVHQQQLSDRFKQAIPAIIRGDLNRTYNIYQSLQTENWFAQPDWLNAWDDYWYRIRSKKWFFNLYKELIHRLGVARRVSVTRSAQREHDREPSSDRTPTDEQDFQSLKNTLMLCYPHRADHTLIPLLTKFSGEGKTLLLQHALKHFQNTPGLPCDEKQLQQMRWKLGDPNAPALLYGLLKQQWLQQPNTLSWPQTFVGKAPLPTFAYKKPSINHLSQLRKTIRWVLVTPLSQLKQEKLRLNIENLTSDQRQVLKQHLTQDINQTWLAWMMHLRWKPSFSWQALSQQLEQFTHWRRGFYALFHEIDKKSDAIFHQSLPIHWFDANRKPYLQSIKQLKNFSQRYVFNPQASGLALDTVNQLVQSGQDNDPLHAVDQAAKKMRVSAASIPLRNAVQHILSLPSQAVWQQLSHTALIQVNQDWQQTMTPGLQALFSHFPFNRQGADIDIIQLQAWFAPNSGKLWQWVHDHLGAFVEYHQQWRARRLFESTAPISNNFLAFLSQAQQLSLQLPSAGHTMQFAIYPQPTPGIAMFSLQFGTQRWAYHNTPQHWQRFQWPCTQPEIGASQTVISANQHRHTHYLHTEHLPWLHLLAMAKLTPLTNQQWRATWSTQPKPVHVLLRHANLFHLLLTEHWSVPNLIKLRQ